MANITMHKAGNEFESKRTCEHVIECFNFWYQTAGDLDMKEPTTNKIFKDDMMVAKGMIAGLYAAAHQTTIDAVEAAVAKAMREIAEE